MIIFLLLWAFLTVYSIAGLCILTVALCRWVWGLIPEGAEIRDRQVRMEHDGELVRLGRVPGYRG
jgi:hypothetical protein